MFGCVRLPFVLRSSEFSKIDTTYITSLNHKKNVTILNTTTYFSASALKTHTTHLNNPPCLSSSSVPSSSRPNKKTVSVCALRCALQTMSMRQICRIVMFAVEKPTWCRPYRVRGTASGHVRPYTVTLQEHQVNYNTSNTTATTTRRFKYALNSPPNSLTDWQIESILIHSDWKRRPNVTTTTMSRGCLHCRQITCKQSLTHFVRVHFYTHINTHINRTFNQMHHIHVHTTIWVIFASFLASSVPAHLADAYPMCVSVPDANAQWREYASICCVLFQSVSRHSWGDERRPDRNTHSKMLLSRFPNTNTAT